MGRSGERWPSVADARPSRADDDQPPGYRYGVVLLLVSVLVVFAIVAPDTDWSRALGFALEGAGLVVVLATSRARGETRRTRALVAGIAASFVVIAIAGGALPVGLTFLLECGARRGHPVRPDRGASPSPPLTRRDQTGRRRGSRDLPAGRAAVRIHHRLGLAAGQDPLLRRAHGVTIGDRVYFSFSTLTTTGYGDFTAATSLGHALAVVETLVGQLYLVTVIAILVGNLARR